ncbi:BTAD domain-containing putative transcriptional regulator [Streptomyces xanthochromogenes]|uniref:AfsR/SARP family transcriptional regulator n=1 Tax=Streptomyces xanthochromogenes TaxID=67384 RepID=UPI0037A53FDB
MDIKVLGPFSVRERGGTITSPWPQATQVLALLAAQAGGIVPTAHLIEELWPGLPPRHAEDLVEGHVRHLRSQMGAPAARTGRAEVQPTDAALASVPGGYRLDSGDGAHDARAFQRAAGAGYRAMETEDFERAAGRLREALGLWGGKPYAGVRTGPHLRAHAARLEESWKRALDQWIAAGLQLGRCRELHADLLVLLSDFRPRQPLYEGLWAGLQLGGDPCRLLRNHQRLSRGSRIPMASASVHVCGHPKRSLAGNFAAEPAITGRPAGSHLFAWHSRPTGLPTHGIGGWGALSYPS